VKYCGEKPLISAVGEGGVIRWCGGIVGCPARAGFFLDMEICES